MTTSLRVSAVLRPETDWPANLHPARSGVRVGTLEKAKMTQWKLIFGLSLCVMGCAPAQPTGDVVDTVPASGFLTHKGAPLEFYRVSFFPKDNRPAMGETNAEGKFTLGTNKPGDGAVVGNHKVAITWIGPPSTNPNEGMTEFTSPPPPKVKLDPKYSDPETSGLVLEVPDGGSAELKVDLP